MAGNSAATERPFDYHTMTNLNRMAALEAAVLCLDGLQRLTPEEIVMGTAVLYAGLCDRLGVDPHDLYTMGQKVMRPDPFFRRANSTAQSLSDTIRLRVGGDSRVSYC